MGLDAARREQLAVGSLLHDLGKIGISERILHKPARLTQEEFAIIQLHPRIGYRLIEQVPALRADRARRSCTTTSATTAAATRPA